MMQALFDREKRTYIYALRCPIIDAVCYVGKSDNPQSRYEAHIGDGWKELLRTERYGYLDLPISYSKPRWIAFLLALSSPPILDILEEARESTWGMRERYWYERYISLGHPLTNGKGAVNWLSWTATFDPFKECPYTSAAIELLPPQKEYRRLPLDLLPAVADLVCQRTITVPTDISKAARVLSRHFDVTALVIALVKERNAYADQDALQAMIDEAVDEVRAETQTPAPQD